MTQRALWRILVASLCVNALLAGYVGVLWLRPPPAVTKAMSPEVFIARIAERLPEEDRAVLMAAFAKYEADLAQDHPEFMAVYRQLAGALRRDEIDQDEIRRLTGRLAALNSRAMRLVTAVYVDATPKFSPETRRMMAKRFEQ